MAAFSLAVVTSLIEILGSSSSIVTVAVSFPNVTPSELDTLEIVIVNVSLSSPMLSWIMGTFKYPPLVTVVVPEIAV